MLGFKQSQVPSFRWFLLTSFNSLLPFQPKQISLAEQVNNKPGSQLRLF